MATTSRKRAGRRTPKAGIVRVADAGEATGATSPERALAALLERLAALKSETLAASDALTAFRTERRERLGAVEEELFAARRLEERLLRLRREAEEWASGDGRAEPPKARRKAARIPPLSPAPSRPPEPAEPWLPLKELYRTLARKLHPDFAKTDAERERKSALMARANAAYGSEDRVLLELLYAQASSDAEALDATPERRGAHAERRLATLEPMVQSLEKELSRVQASSAWKDLDEARRRAATGGDFFATALYTARRDARTATERALTHAAELAALARSARPRPPGERAAPVADRLMRKAVARPDRQKINEEARRLGSDLRRLAAREPWQVGLSLFAFFGEVSAMPPPGLASLAAAGERWEALRPILPAAPPFERVMVRLPAFLEVGLRAHAKRLSFGIQVRRAELLAGIRGVLASAEVAPLARAVLAVMGPRAPCEACGETVFFAHVFRTRGLDDVHALVCPTCAAVTRSYRTLGSPEGLEALAPYAVELGAVVEQPVRLGDASVLLGFLPAEARRLTARKVVERLRELYFDGFEPDFGKRVRLRDGKVLLAPATALGPGAKLCVALGAEAPMSDKELARTLRARVRARFNPTSTAP